MDNEPAKSINICFSKLDSDLLPRLLAELDFKIDMFFSKDARIQEPYIKGASETIEQHIRQGMILKHRAKAERKRSRKKRS